LKKRPLIGPPSAHQFRVLVLPSGEGSELAEPLAGADGSLIYQPWLAFLAFLPLWLQRLLLPLLLLLLLLALLLWFLFGPGGRTAGPEPTPTVAPTPAVVVPVKPADDVPTPAVVAPTTAPVATPAPKPPPPAIARFEVVPPATPGSGPFRIVWEVTGADEVKLGGQTKDAQGSEPIGTLSDDNYELEATNSGGTVKKSIGILILRPPSVASFTADKAEVRSGEQVKLTWLARGGQRASISAPGLEAPRTVDPRSGSTDFEVLADTPYTLTVDNELGRDTQTVIVRVAQ
jgi:hypothetical protein